VELAKSSDTYHSEEGSGIGTKESKMTREIDDLGQQFASDNYAGICPEAWAAMERANRGHATAYGDDDLT